MCVCVCVWVCVCVSVCVCLCVCAPYFIVAVVLSQLQKKDGFMSRFYLVGENMSPALVWGFLGTDETFKQKCLKFKVIIQDGHSLDIYKLICILL